MKRILRKQGQGLFIFINKNIFIPCKSYSISPLIFIISSIHPNIIQFIDDILQVINKNLLILKN